MKAANQGGWGGRHQADEPTLDSHQIRTVPQSRALSPTFASPRAAPKPPSSSFKSNASSALKGFQSVFARRIPRSPSATSLHSAYSTSNLSHIDSVHLHPPAPPFSPMPQAQSPGSDYLDDDAECPVCLEPLSFSFRLPGEKPHVVPECGHALHEACFSAVYGPPPGQRSTVPRKANLGVCGVCRRPMKIGDGDTSKTNKLAALTGMGDPHAPHLFPGRGPAGLRNHSARSSPAPGYNQPYNPNDDDPLDHHAMSVRSGPGGEGSSYVVAPHIQVRPEFNTLTRSNDSTQPLTCIVVVELPARRSAPVPTPLSPSEPPVSRNGAGLRRQDTERSNAPSTSSNFSSVDGYARGYTDRAGYDPCTPNWQPQKDTESPRYEDDSPFASIVEDLRARIMDWKGHALVGLGPLMMYDLLSVRRDALVREFYVYLFKEAIICVVEEKKRSLGRFLPSPGSQDLPPAQAQAKGVLRLKGRIYVRHIKRVTASYQGGDMSLTIEMEDERLDSFILVFKDRSTLEAWKNQIQSLVASFQQQQHQQQYQQQSPPPFELEEFGGSAKVARVLSGSTATTVSTVDSLLHHSSRSTMSSSTSHGSMPPRQMMQQQQHKLSTLGEEDVLSSYDSSPLAVTPHLAGSGASNSLQPLPHAPLDLILIISLPPPNAVPSTAALKVRVIKTSLDFVIASLGPRDRLSLVTFEVGQGGRVRKTPYLSLGRNTSRNRLSKFIDEIGQPMDDNMEDEFLVRASREEKTDVVTAVNHALDVVLQRKTRNSVSGMILVSDAADSTRRAQMDLVLARAEAANMPIHSFGYGRSHDPASLWLMSNHTSGTYTFVKDWYDLRGCLAGCIGGMMSIGLLNMKLHMKIVDGNRFRIRKVSGGPSSILATDGQHVDVDVGELRYGECKEMLVELELDNTEARRQQVRGENRALNATDQFVQSMGLDALAIDDPTDLMDGLVDRMIDEVPVFEVDGAYLDPAAGKHVSRLAHPVLLTITLLPATSSGTGSPRPSNKPSDSVIVRRRMELLASDMITRALVLVSRKNYAQAQKILSETKRILHTVLQTVSKSLPPPSSGGGPGAATMRNRKETLALAAVRTLQAILQDLQVLAEALEENVELFAHDQRNFGAQQAMILRDQKSWSNRSATERLFWTMDNAIELCARSADWVGGRD